MDFKQLEIQQQIGEGSFGKVRPSWGGGGWGPGGGPLPRRSARPTARPPPPPLPSPARCAGQVYLAKWRETTVAVKVLAGAAEGAPHLNEEFPEGGAATTFGGVAANGDAARFPHPLYDSLRKVRGGSVCVGWGGRLGGEPVFACLGRGRALTTPPPPPPPPPPSPPPPPTRRRPR